MLGRLLLIAVQLVVGWYAALEIGKVLPRVGSFDLFLLAALFAVMIWVIGLLAAAVLKDITGPTMSTLLFAFGTAVLFAALSVLPDVSAAVQSVVGAIDLRVYPLVGAVLGYAVQN